MDVGTSVYGPKFRIRRYPDDRYRPTASCWRTPVSRINRRIPFSTAMASSAATTCRDSPRRRHSGRTYIRLSSPKPSSYFVPSRSAPQPTTSPATVRATVASISSAGSTASMSPCPSSLVAISACCSSRSRATSSSSQGTTVTATPPTPFTARPGSADEGAEHRREEPQTVGAPARSSRPVGAEARLDRVLRVRHEAHHVAGFVGDPGDVAAGSVRVPADVSEHDPPLLLELIERPLIRDELPVLVLQRDGDPLAERVLAGPGGVGVLHRHRLDPRVRARRADHHPAEEPGRAVRRGRADARPARGTGAGRVPLRRLEPERIPPRHRRDHQRSRQRGGPDAAPGARGRAGLRPRRAGRTACSG